MVFVISILPIFTPPPPPKNEKVHDMRNLKKYFITHITAVNCKTDASDWMKRCILSDQQYNNELRAFKPSPTHSDSLCHRSRVMVKWPSNSDRSRGLVTSGVTRGDRSGWHHPRGDTWMKLHFGGWINDEHWTSDVERGTWGAKKVISLEMTMTKKSRHYF